MAHQPQTCEPEKVEAWIVAKEGGSLVSTTSLFQGLLRVKIVFLQPCLCTALESVKYTAKQRQ